ncbi:MAG: hypothetical protein HYX97_03005 [Chloroflexi bacterium]|nr:hypothetical protein [Chloroflexota bacterium]
MDPTNPVILYAGGIPLWKYDGTTWTEVSKTVSDPTHGIHVDQHSPTDFNFALGGSQDNGTEKWTGSSTWQLIFGGDGADSAISSSNPNTNWAVSFQELAIRRTISGGDSFTAADSGIDKTGVPFIARFEKCPNNDDVFIAGTDNIWRSDNFFSGVSPTWSDNPSGNFSSGVRPLALAPFDATCDTYAFGRKAGSLRLTSDGGSTWVNIDAGNAVPDRAVTDLAFDPTNSNVLYLTLSGFDEGTPGQPRHVFKTTNALAASPTRSNVSPPVNLPHNTIVLDPFDPKIVYVGTDLGIWKSTDGGSSWTHMGPETGMPNVAVFDLQIDHTTGRLVAFTHGRGAFVLVNTTSTTLTVAKTGTGIGTIISSPAGITCGITCTAAFAPGASVTLTATATTGSAFTGWGGEGCSGTGTCTVTMSTDRSVTATFSRVFTDATLTAQTTVIKTAHITDLRAAINTLRSQNGLAAFTFTDSTLTSGSTPMKRIHVTELRTALAEAYQAAGQTQPTYTDPTITAGQTVIKASHLSELRTAVRSLE